MTQDPNWPASDAGIPLRVKFRLWIAAIVADESSDNEQKAVEASDEATDEPGVEYPEPEPAGLSPDTGYDPLP